MELLLDHFFKILSSKKEVSPGLIYHLKRHIKQETFLKNACLLRFGEKSEKMYFINDGPMRGEIQKVVNGVESLLSSRFMMKNEIVFNVASFLTGAGSEEAIYTLKPTVALTLTNEAFHSIGSVCPELYELAWLLGQGPRCSPISDLMD